MLLLTYATHNTGYLEALKISAKKHNYNLIIIGYGEKWEGFTKRLEKILNYLKKNVDKDEIVCFVDAFDTIMLKDKKELEDKFKKMNTDKVVYSATMDNFFRSFIFGKKNDKDEKHEFNRLVGAPYIGKCKSIIELFANLCDTYECGLNRDDQVLLTHYYKKCIDCIELDKKSDLFYNLETDDSLIDFYTKLIFQKNDEPVKINNKYHKFINNEIILFNNSIPCILHGNGNLNMDAFCNKLGLPTRKKEKRNYFEYSTKTFIDKIINLILTYLVKIFHLVLIIVIMIGPYISNNYYFLIGLIVFYITVSVQWNILKGNCIITVIENKLNRKNDIIPKNELDGEQEVGFMAKLMMEKFSLSHRSVDILIMLIPFVNSLVCSFKLLYLMNKCKIKK